MSKLVPVGSIENLKSKDDPTVKQKSQIHEIKTIQDKTIILGYDATYIADLKTLKDKSILYSIIFNKSRPKFSKATCFLQVYNRLRCSYVTFEIGESEIFVMEFFHNQGELFKLPPIFVSDLDVSPSKINVMGDFVTVLTEEDPTSVYLVNRKNYRYIYKKELRDHLTFFQTFRLFPGQSQGQLNVAVSVSENKDNSITVSILGVVYPVFTINSGRNENGFKCMKYLKNCEKIYLTLKSLDNPDTILTIPFYYVNKDFNSPLPIYNN